MHLYPRVGELGERSGSVTTPGLYFPPGGAVLHSCRRSWLLALFLVIGLAICIKIVRIQRLLVLVVVPRCGYRDRESNNLHMCVLLCSLYTR